jgi:DRTGG domain
METIKTKSEPEVKGISLPGEKKMKLKELAEQLGWELKTQNVPVEAEVRTGYASDLLSDVLANSIEGDLWVTRQTHLNIVAIAVMRDLSGILLVNGAQPEPDTVEKAAEKMVPIFRTPLPTFEIVGRLYQLGIVGER